MKGVIDRYESRFAVIQTRKGFIRIERERLPEGVAEGAHIEIRGGCVIVDKKKTEKARKKVSALLRQLQNSGRE